MNNKNFLAKLQLLVYLLEAGTLTALLALAAAGSAEFALGPLGRALLAAAVPLPCHLLLWAHLAWASRSLPAKTANAPLVRPLRLPLPLPA